uniref:FA complementation group M n=1 Tax=Labrus bergylta TaxID=56723 RepID=A0A3Q3EH87_9LABR
MSSGSNQRTLFQTWGATAPQKNVVQPKKDGRKAAGRRKTTQNNSSQVAPTHPARNPLWTQFGQEPASTSEDPKPAFEDEDDDDDLMLVAVYEAEKSLELDNANCQHDSNAGTESTALSPMPSGGHTHPDFPGFDSSSAKVWIYPTNYPLREYQLKISEAALFANSLVCLPTGLGKTFIASVVMYNFYRWYPSGKIVFMAPTKPLVAQQIEACYKVMGIPQAHMAELTGSTAAKQRQEVWRTKRVFFLTPQVMVNDLSRESCPAQQIKCVVIDEAHKALGNHAYCQVIRQLASQTLQFRILALSATPGGDTKSVQSVISNLLISHIELRSEESPDIQAHSHQRNVEKVVVPLGEALSAQQARYLQVLEKFMSRLVQNRVMAQRDLRTLCKYQIILARDQFRSNPPQQIKGPQLEGDFALCISLYHGYELLMQMGLRSLFFYFQGIMDGSKGRARNELQKTPTFMDLYHEMETMFVKPSAGPDEPFIYSHPKLEKLEGVVLQHFKLWAESPQEVSTRVMIFSSFRESVQEIADMLNQHAPLIRVMTFMGQASAGKGVKGFTQKEQLEVVNRFRTGGFNTLVSTCIGEEGLDIGEVDLIVCFDAQKSPIRMVQRMGRTGRKRKGRIVVILAEGREERTYNQSQSSKNSVYKSIIRNKNGFHMFPNSPRMLPDGVNPTLHKMHITCGQFDHQESGRRSIGRRKSRSEGRASLIHPQNLTHPTLKPSRFISLPSDPLPQDIFKSGPPSRELSLWEWRHWQHKVLPTHAVDHSLRCRHFTEVMQLIDGMREENEGECRYEQELLPYLGKEDAGGVVKNKQKKKTQKVCAKANKRQPKPSHSTFSDLDSVDEEEHSDFTRKKRVTSGSVAGKQTHSVQHDTPGDDITDRPGSEGTSNLLPNNHSPEANMFQDSFISNKRVIKSDEPVSLDKLSQLISNTEEDVELQAMFYLPKWASSPHPRSVNHTPGRDERLKVILANVAELLSRSPPSLEDDLEEAGMPPPSPPPSPPWPQQPFRVSFTLGADDDDDEEDDDYKAMVSDSEDASPRADNDVLPASKIMDHDWPRQEPERNRAAGSPSWDEVFGEEEENKEREDKNMNDFQLDFALEAEEEEEEEECWDDARKDKKMPLLTDGGVANDMDESMDLFGDDEAFLQMTIPDVSTPGVTPGKSPHAAAITRSPIKTSNLLHKQTPTNPCSTTNAADSAKKQNPDSLDGSHDYFPVNFDLGYSFEESEEEVEEDVFVQRTSPTSPPLKKRALSNSSTPYKFHRQTKPPQSSASTLSTPQTLSEQGRRGTSSRLALPLMSKGGLVCILIFVYVSIICKFWLNIITLFLRSVFFFRSYQDKWRDDFKPPVCSLSDSEMCGVYLKSVRSPAVHGKFKMSYRNQHNMDIFSQVPEIDESYAEDSFVVGNEVDEVEEAESSEDGAEDIELMPEDSYVDGRRQYATRRRVFIHKARAGVKTAAESVPRQRAAVDSKRSRVIRVQDSSEEEAEEVDDKKRVVTEGGFAAPLWPKTVRLEPTLLSFSCRCRQRIENQHLLSDELDFAEPESLLSSKKQTEALPSTSSVPQSSSGPDAPVSASPAPPGPVSILADSRCISNGVDLMSCLRQRHAATVHVCSLDGCYFIVSNRMAAERHSQSDLASMPNRKRLAERLNGLQGSFERVCLIVEKDRTKPGETSRPFQRTRFYDSTLTALVNTGVRLLWSSSPEESAGLLADLARLEQRKGQGIAVPLEVKGQHRQQALQLYSSLPSVNYAHALNMSHNFSSIAQLINSSVDDVQKGGCMGRTRAEEVYRFLRYSCDSFLMHTSKSGRSSSS